MLTHGMQGQQKQIKQQQSNVAPAAHLAPQGPAGAIEDRGNVNRVPRAGCPTHAEHGCAVMGRQPADVQGVQIMRGGHRTQPGEALRL